MSKGPKTYIVWSGRRPGVYDTWAEAREQVIGVRGARFKSFVDITAAEAEKLFRSGAERATPAKPSTQSTPADREAVKASIAPDAIAVDASTSGNPGPTEYHGVYVETGDEVFRSRVYPVGTNNIGEFLALVHALAWQEQTGYRVPVYSDSRNAINWVRQKQCRSKLPRTAATELLYSHVDRALAWLATHDLSGYDIRKWPTEVLGEIPADYGRK